VVVNCNFHSFGCTIDVVWRCGSAVSEVFSLNIIVVFCFIGMRIIEFEVLSTSNGSTKRHMCSMCTNEHICML
jgi:hypothetical protein